MQDPDENFDPGLVDSVASFVPDSVADTIALGLLACLEPSAA